MCWKSTHVALLKHFKNIPQDDISVASSSGNLNAVKQLFLDTSEPKKKRGKHEEYDAFQNHPQGIMK